MFLEYFLTNTQLSLRLFLFFVACGRKYQNRNRLLPLSIHKVLAFFPTLRNIKIHLPAVLADRGLDFSAHFAAKNQALTSKIVATQESGNA